MERTTKWRKKEEGLPKNNVARPNMDGYESCDLNALSSHAICAQEKCVDVMISMRLAKRREKKTNFKFHPTHLSIWL